MLSLSLRRSRLDGRRCSCSPAAEVSPAAPALPSARPCPGMAARLCARPARDSGEPNTFPRTKGDGIRPLPMAQQQSKYYLR